MASTRLQALFGPVTGLVQLAGTLLVFGLAVWEVGNGRITIGAYSRLSPISTDDVSDPGGRRAGQFNILGERQR